MPLAMAMASAMATVVVVCVCVQSGVGTPLLRCDNQTDMRRDCTASWKHGMAWVGSGYGCAGVFFFWFLLLRVRQEERCDCDESALNAVVDLLLHDAD